MASMPKDRVRPPPRSLALAAPDCIMFRIPKGSTEYKVVARRPRYDLAGPPQIVCRKQPSPPGAFLAWRIIARHALSPSIPRARALYGQRGLTAQRGQATAPPCQEWNRVRPN